MNARLTIEIDGDLPERRRGHLTRLATSLLADLFGGTGVILYGPPANRQTIEVSAPPPPDDADLPTVDDITGIFVVARQDGVPAVVDAPVKPRRARKRKGA